MTMLYVAKYVLKIHYSNSNWRNAGAVLMVQNEKNGSYRISFDLKPSVLALLLPNTARSFA